MTTGKPPTRNWLMKAVELEADCDISAGPVLPVVEMTCPASSALVEGKREKVHEAFSILMRQLRLEQDLTVEQLAHRIEVEPEQLHRIERHIGYKPPPRTLHRLAEWHRLPVNAVIQMAGGVKKMNRSLEESAMCFAAKSESFEQLNSAEKRLLNEFVQCLREKEE
jgi:transcriptional regulator with XRE-family HTH domain